MDKEIELHMEDKEAKDRAESQEKNISDVPGESLSEEAGAGSESARAGEGTPEESGGASQGRGSGN